MSYTELNKIAIVAGGDPSLQSSLSLAEFMSYSPNSISFDTFDDSHPQNLPPQERISIDVINVEMKIKNVKKR